MSGQTIIVGPPKITRFEKARIVGARALQISMGAPILVDAAENTNPIDIALSDETQESANHLTIEKNIARWDFPRYSIQNGYYLGASIFSLFS